MAAPGICPGVLAPLVKETQGRVLTPTFLEPVLPALFSVVFCCFSTMGCSVCVCVCVYFEVSLKSTILLTSGRNNL